MDAQITNSKPAPKGCLRQNQEIRSIKKIKVQTGITKHDGLTHDSFFN